MNDTITKSGTAHNRRRLLYGAGAMLADRSAAGDTKTLLGIGELLARPRAPQRSFVYLLDTYGDDERYFKIGRSVQPDARLRQLQGGKGAAMPPGWMGSLVRPLAIREGGVAEERTIHIELGQYRLPRTEWFLANLAVRQYIVGQGVWDIWNGDALPDDYDFDASDPCTPDVLPVGYNGGMPSSGSALA